MSTRMSLDADEQNGVRWHLYRELAEEGEPLMLELRAGMFTALWRVPERFVKCLRTLDEAKREVGE